MPICTCKFVLDHEHNDKHAIHKCFATKKLNLKKSKVNSCKHHIILIKKLEQRFASYVLLTLLSLYSCSLLCIEFHNHLS